MIISLVRRHPVVWGVGAFFIVFALPTQAVPPPDFMINVGTQVAQFFSLALLFTTAIASSLYQSFQLRFPSGVSRRKFWLGAFVSILVFSGVGAHVFGKILQERKLAQVLAKSEMQQVSPEEVAVVTSTPIIPPITTTTVASVSLPLMLANTRFSAMIASPTSTYFVLDAREDVEYEYGNFPGSRHVRYADLKAGEWQSLPTDRPIIVLCWSGIRGKEVATFLRGQGVAASFLEEGANGWVDFGGRWQGAIKFSDRYPDKLYAVLFSREETTKRVQKGAVLIDAREPAARAKKPYPGVTAISILSTPSDALAQVLAAVPSGAAVITICGDYVDCFEAKVVGIELERRGHDFLGRYDLSL